MGGTAAVSGAAWLWSRPPDDLEPVRRKRVARIGYAIEPPYSFVDASGRVTGEGPETARLVADRLGWSVEWVQTQFGGLIPELIDGRFHLVTAGLFVTAARARLVRFAAPELRVAPGLLVRADAMTAPRSYEELVRAPQRVAVVAGSAEEDALRGKDASRLLAVPDALAAAATVDSGLVDVLALSFPSVRAMAAARPSLRAIRVATPPGERERCVAAACRPAGERLAAAWSKALESVRGTPPHLQAIARFGFAAADLPPPSYLCTAP